MREIVMLGTGTPVPDPDRAGVGRLVLTHLLPAPRSAIDLAALADQARAAGYRGPVDTPADLDRIPPTATERTPAARDGA